MKAESAYLFIKIQIRKKLLYKFNKIVSMSLKLKMITLKEF